MSVVDFERARFQHFLRTDPERAWHERRVADRPRRLKELKDYAEEVKRKNDQLPDGYLKRRREENLARWIPDQEAEFRRQDEEWENRDGLS